MEKLLLKGADVNTKDSNGNTPLQYAVWEGRSEMVSLLIKHGADVNVETGKSTPIHTSVLKGNYQITELLIGRDSKLNVINADGKTPLDLAVELQLSLIHI